MPKVNGVTVTSSEYKVLKMAIKEQGNKKFFEGIDAKRLNALKKKGLVSGLAMDNGFRLIEVNYSGEDFVSDWRLRCILSVLSFVAGIAADNVVHFITTLV